MTDYQIAKARFGDSDALTPDSLTRRKDTLIACYFTPRWDKKTLQRMIAREILMLFPKARIHKVKVDRLYITRCYFSLVVEVQDV